MNSKEFQENKIEKSEKERIWNEKMEKVSARKDRLGKEIDENIKETVVGLNLFNIPTAASCEGHIDHGYSAPWITIKALNEPDERFNNEKEIIQKVADKYNVAFEYVRRGENLDIWREALKEFAENGETEEYQKWRKENKKLIAEVQSLLDEFYNNRQVADNLKIIINEDAEGSFRIHNGGKDYSQARKLSEQGKQERVIRLKEYRQEMKEFTEFLKRKFFESD